MGRAAHGARTRTGDRGIHPPHDARTGVRNHRRRHPAQSATEKEQEMTTLDLRRRFFAEELEAVCKLRSPHLVDAFATVPREQFLGPGPWMVLAESPSMPGAASFSAAGLNLRTTPDADPGRVYHNIAVAIDPARQLFNGQPGTLAVWLDALDLAPGARVLHVGAGLGYYTAIMAQAVGPSGRVVAFEVDETL